ncbi:hypothetical protein CBR_g25940 [Chara braunii]|uniref:glutamate--tRNA ligase n=1 Tax=Chara braunii TaxID=69332 RepID=A0A388L6T3_CHABU|nr:hypothetical protein CBR_g25940 [Chara braunii]|eukprot:GBG78006.1 hypothetical protein CBR_g25940 [Chara braunii]
MTGRLTLLHVARSCPSRLSRCCHVAPRTNVEAGKDTGTHVRQVSRPRLGPIAGIGAAGEGALQRSGSGGLGVRFACPVASRTSCILTEREEAGFVWPGPIGRRALPDRLQQQRSWLSTSNKRSARWLGDRLAERCYVVAIHAAAATTAEDTYSSSSSSAEAGAVRVRFAPSPTGNLHVGGARTALFNWLFARNQKGKFIIRVEDTDLERSTRASEEAMIRDLKWLGLDWDEGPDCGGGYGPYRQSERTDIYREFAERLVASGHAYYCFCTDEELEAMRKEAEAKKLPPVYSGRWATATQEEVEAELAKGSPYTYRFRVPKHSRVAINDLIREEVSWSTDTLGDFIILRSNKQPVYNFCVAVDDASMKISHVIRAEEHLPNTLRQVLIYEALGFKPPQFGHVSLILAPDRSKLSKRHGATSVGEFREKGFLAEAMLNYLALLGWNDGTVDEIFTVEELVEKFSIDRVTKSAAIFDATKLGWMNGQHLRSCATNELRRMLGERWVQAGILTRSDGPFVDDAVELIKEGITLVSDCEANLLDLLAYPLHQTIASEEAAAILADGFPEVVAAILSAFDDGDLANAIAGGESTWKTWVKGVGKKLSRKGKRLFMPIRLALTGSMQGPDVGQILAMLQKAEGTGAVANEGGILVPLADRVAMLKSINWGALVQQQQQAPSAVPAS